MKKRFEEIDKLRGIAICMVLLYHSILVYPVNLHEIGWCSALHTFLWKIEMPLFFLVSGFCITESCAAGWSAYGMYFKKKAVRVLIPHVVFGLLDILPRSIPNPLVHEQAAAGEALSDFLFYGGSDWFLWVLFVIFVCFPAAVWLYGKGTGGKLAAAACSIGLYAASSAVTDLFLLSMAAEFQIYLFGGYVLRKEIYETGRQGQLKSPAAAAAGAFVMTGISAAGWANEGSAGMLCFAAGGSVLFLCIADRLKGWFGTFLARCGTCSLPMYLLGGYALVASRTLLVSILGVRQPIVLIAGNFLMDVTATLAIAWFVIRPVKLFCFLTGGGQCEK